MSAVAQPLLCNRCNGDLVNHNGNIPNGNIPNHDIHPPLKIRGFGDVTLECFTLKRICQCLSTFIPLLQKIEIIPTRDPYKGMATQAKITKLFFSFVELPAACKKFCEVSCDGSKTWGETFFAAIGCVHPFYEVAELGAKTTFWAVPGASALKVVAPCALIVGKAKEAFAPSASIAQAAEDPRKKTIAFLKLMETVSYIAIGVFQLLSLAVDQGLLSASILPFTIPFSNLILVAGATALVLSILGFYYKNWGAPVENNPVA